MNSISHCGSNLSFVCLFCRTSSESVPHMKISTQARFGIHRSVSNTSTSSTSSASVTSTFENYQPEQPLSNSYCPQDIHSQPSCSSPDSGFSSQPLSDILQAVGIRRVSQQTGPKNTGNDTKTLRCDEVDTPERRTEEFPADMCVVCREWPRDASIVHEGTGHQVCCFTCANKLKSTKRKCPVCRQKIQMVIKNFLWHGISSLQMSHHLRAMKGCILYYFFVLFNSWSDWASVNQSHPTVTAKLVYDM